MAFAFDFTQIYSLLTTSLNETIVAVAIWLIIFAVIFDILNRTSFFPKASVFIIALVGSFMGLLFADTLQVIHFIIGLGGTAVIIVFFALVILAFILFALGRPPRKR